MKITIDSPTDGRSCSVEVDGDDLDINEVYANLILPVLRAQGYLEETIHVPLRDDWSEYNHFILRSGE